MKWGQYFYKQKGYKTWNLVLKTISQNARVIKLAKLEFVFVASVHNNQILLRHTVHQTSASLQIFFNANMRNYVT